MVPTKKVERTPYEIWHGKAPKLSHLRVLGSETLMKRDTPDKLDPRSIKCIFIGYPKDMMGYYFYYPLENKIFVAQNVEFFDNSLMVQEASGSHGLLKSSRSGGGLELIQEEDTQPSKNTSEIPQEPNRYGFYVDVEEHELGDLNEPPNYKAALSDPEFDKWLEAMNTEIQYVGFSSSASALQVLRILGSIFTSVYAADQKLKNAYVKSFTKSNWDDLILYYEGPSDVKENRLMDLKLCYNTFKFKEGETLIQTFTRYKALMNELVNDDIKLSKLEINIGFINGLPKKWLSFYQSLRNKNHVKDSKLASLFDSPNDEEDTRSSHEYLNDLEEEYQARTLLAKSKSSSQHEPELRPTKDFVAIYNKVKTKLALLSLSASASKAATVKNKGVIAEAYECDEEEVSSDDNEMVEVKVLMALAEDNDAISKEGARNGEWVKIFM
ncbi:retrovirus-related pol polyprotein from transposon TNT 1-94 [Tanacetum coccineum]